ncbi:MAG: LacI family DNA-binding transcriptional regulator [Mycetocola sp.]
MATMRDVAARAGVSVATVSFTLNNTKTVSEPTRARVEEAMRDLGYRRNAVGRALARRHTQIIAMLYPALRQGMSHTTSLFHTGAATAAAEQGYRLILWPMDDKAEGITDLAQAGLVDGAILMEVHLDDRRVEALREHGLPFTLIGRTRDPEGLSYVDVDFENTITDAVERLAAGGHRRIAYADGDPTDANGAVIPRYGPILRSRSAFLAACAARGLRGSINGGATTAAAGKALVTRLLAEQHPPTAILALNEFAALGAISQLRSMGKRVPEDVSVVGVSSSPSMAAITEPELSHYLSPGDALGRLAVGALIGQLSGDPNARIATVIRGEFTEGASLGPAPASESNEDRPRH